MSAPPVGAPDPLEALRAADHRPRHVVVREEALAAWRSRSGAGVPGATRRAGMFLLGALMVAAVSWRLFTASSPPVEASLPLAVPATGTSDVDAADAASTSSVTSGANDDGRDNGGAVSASHNGTGEVIVHVAGAVRRPGLVQGVSGWRVADAIDAAGGVAGPADLDRLNLAAHIADGQRIFVPVVGEAEPVVLDKEVTMNEPANGPVNLNTADSSALQQLPGVGPATADAILAHRDAHGSFATVDALVAVRGIGPATLEGLRDLVLVG